MGFAHGFTLRVKRGGGSDRFGNSLPGTEHDVEGCAAAPAGSVEVVNGQQTVTTQDTVYGPYDADVKAADAVTIPAGQPIEAGDYKVDGQPQRWKNPYSGREFGCVVRLTRTTGGT